MKTCCKEWALKLAPRQSIADTQVSFEEEHVCPTCQESYLVWFTRIGRPQTRTDQVVAVTIKPSKDCLQPSGYMHSTENGLGGASRL